MSTCQKLLTIRNVTNALGLSRIISIVGEDLNIAINPNSSQEVDLADVQFDDLFMDTLCAYKDSSYITVVFEGDSLTADEINDLRYGGGSGEELAATSYTTELAQTSVALTDGTDFTIVESTLRTTRGLAAELTVDPSTAVGQITVEVYQDSGRLVKVSEHVIDLSDVNTYSSYLAFGFKNDTTGTLYCTLRASGVPALQTADFTLSANAMEPASVPEALTDPYGDGIEDNGLGQAQVALGTTSGLEFSSSKLQVKSDTTAAAYVTTGLNGASVTGAVDTTTAQVIAGEKQFNSAGLVPRGATGAPATGTWTAGTEVLDSANIKWRCISGGTPGTWELADTVTIESEVVVSSAISQGGNELLKIPVTGNVGQALWLRVWARRDSGTAEFESDFRARIYQTSDKRARELVWQGKGIARQTYIDTLLPASQTYLEVNDNDVADVDELLCVYASDVRYELGRCSGRTLGNFDVSEALVDASSWAINTLVLPVSEWHLVPWYNTDGDPTDQNHILLEIRHDGIATDPDLVFYAQALAMSLGVVR